MLKVIREKKKISHQTGNVTIEKVAAGGKGGGIVIEIAIEIGTVIEIETVTAIAIEHDAGKTKADPEGEREVEVAAEVVAAFLAMGAEETYLQAGTETPGIIAVIGAGD